MSIVKNSFDFASKVKNINYKNIMASFDVESLFTKIPLYKTIEIIAYPLFQEGNLCTCFCELYFLFHYEKNLAWKYKHLLQY